MRTGHDAEAAPATVETPGTRSKAKYPRTAPICSVNVDDDVYEAARSLAESEKKRWRRALSGRRWGR